MPMAGYLDIPGVKGSALKKNVAGKIVVYGVSHETASSLDPLTGQPKGKVTHKTLVVTKDCDVASPLLYKAMEDGQTFPTVRLDFHQMPPDGGNEENHASIVLAGVHVAFVRLAMPNSKKPENQLLPSYEEVGLAYQAIQWQWHAGGAEGGEKQADQSSLLQAQFTTPPEVELKNMLTDFLKTAIPGIGAATLKAVKGDTK